MFINLFMYLHLFLTCAFERPDRTAFRVHVAFSRLLAFALSVPLQTRSDTPGARGPANLYDIGNC